MAPGDAMNAPTPAQQLQSIAAQFQSGGLDVPSALAALRDLLRRHPDCHAAHTELWNVMDVSGQRDGAVAQLRQQLAALDEAARFAQYKTKVRIADTTVCCIDTRSHALAIRALKLSMAGCEFPRALFFTDRPFDIGPVETVIIDPIRSLQDYSRFVVKQLLQYIDTEYVLIIQWDGYVVNPDCWSEQFFLFDYIGARWPDTIGAYTREGAHNIRIPAAQAVGNGGFSLRSRTLLEALQDPHITLGTYPEDMAICMTYRQYLEQQHGIAFAPVEVAELFSFERVEPAGATFGFHGHINIARFVDDENIRLLESA